MYILVNETKLTISNYGVKRNKITAQDILAVTIPKENATANEVDTLCDYIAANSPVIYIFNDSDETVQTLTGFSVKPHFGLTEAGAWELIVECKSELEYQYGRLLDNNARLKAAQTAQENKIVALAEENAKSIEFEAELLYELSLMQLGLL